MSECPTKWIMGYKTRICQRTLDEGCLDCHNAGRCLGKPQHSERWDEAPNPLKSQD